MPRSPKASGVEPSKEPMNKEEAPEIDDDDESDDDEILEVSDNGRWQKFNEQVTRDIPGIDAAFLAMDTDDGVEVVWNEVRYSNRKSGRKEMLVKILQRLTEFKHTNIVNFIHFWHDRVNNQDRLVFITEYMTSGSLLQFLKKAKRTKKSVTVKMWRRWCRQILSALSYLHQNKIIHGNVSLATIFIQHNGLVKIGSVSPDAIHEHVKTKTEETNRLHYAAPELATEGVTTAADIYAFGICTLEMLNLDLLGNSEGRRTLVNSEAIQQALGQVPDSQRTFIELCLQEDPTKRPKASTLLKNPVLQEIFTLKVLCTLALSQRESREHVEALVDQGCSEDGNHILAEVPHVGRDPTYWKVSQVPRVDLDKLYEEITLDVLYHNDYRPQTASSPQKKDNSNSRTEVPSSNSSTERNSTQFYEKETRHIVTMTCDVKQLEGGKMELLLKLNFEDKMQRELCSELKEGDDANSLAWDLILHGLVNEDDRQKIADLLNQKLQSINIIAVPS